MFCDQTSVKIIDNTKLTIQSYVCFNFVITKVKLSEKYRFYQQNIQLAILGTNVVLYLRLTANICPVYVMQPWVLMEMYHV